MVKIFPANFQDSLQSDSDLILHSFASVALRANLLPLNARPSILYIKNRQKISLTLPAIPYKKSNMHYNRPYYNILINYLGATEIVFVTNNIVLT